MEEWKDRKRDGRRDGMMDEFEQTDSILFCYYPIQYSHNIILLFSISQVEQIRRVNKLWINDNIRVFKTLNIPVKRNIGCAGDIVNTKCDEVNPVDITIDIKSTKKEKPKGPTIKATMAGKGDSTGACCGEENVDIDIDSKGAERNDCQVTKQNGTKMPESLTKFLNELDDQIKSSIEQAEKQR